MHVNFERGHNNKMSFSKNDDKDTKAEGRDTKGRSRWTATV